jgi:hypothetical protein
MCDRRLSPVARGVLGVLVLSEESVPVQWLVDVADEPAAEILAAAAELEYVGLAEARR